MNFTELVNEVGEKTGAATPKAWNRIGRYVNIRYRALASSIGFSTVQRTTATAKTTTGSQYLVFGNATQGVEKLMSVFDAAYSPVRVLAERTFDDLRNSFGISEPATEYAIATVAAHTVTVFLNAVASTSYEYSADVLSNLLTLRGLQEPSFPEDYHDILYHGALSDEYGKQEKGDLSDKEDDKFEARASELRLYFAKSAYLEIAQGIGAQRRRRR